MVLIAIAKPNVIVIDTKDERFVGELTSMPVLITEAGAVATTSGGPGNDRIGNGPIA